MLTRSMMIALALVEVVRERAAMVKAHLDGPAAGAVLLRWAVHKAAEPSLPIPPQQAPDSEVGMFYRLLEVVLETMSQLGDSEYAAISDQLEKALTHSLSV